MEPTAFLAHCQKHGIIIERKDPAAGIVTLSQRFPAGSIEEFVSAETATSILYDIPRSGGSIWGTDGGSVGGAVALKTGIMRLHASGVQKRWLNRLAAITADKVLR